MCKSTFLFTLLTVLFFPSLIVPINGFKALSNFNLSIKHIADETHLATGLETASYNLGDFLKCRSMERNWNESVNTVYLGCIMGNKTKTDLEKAYNNLTSWKDILIWSARLQKLGIENETKIKEALDNAVMVNGLPKTGSDDTGDYYSNYYGELLYGYHFANKYNYDKSKWNLTLAYNNYHDAWNNTGHGFRLYYSPTYTVGNLRFYDECAETIRAFLLFYKFGVNDALQDAEDEWNYINNHHWTGSFFSYTPSWEIYECESGGFLEIISWLRCYDFSVGNVSRLVTDTVNRYLASRWGSPQWTYDPTNTEYYVVVHAHEANSQRRLENTVMAWSIIQGIYDSFNNTEKQWMQDLLSGYNSYDLAWKLLISSASGLYDSITNMFRMHSDGDLSNYATALGTTLMFFMGIVPVNATLAVPIEELHYQYVYNMFDPELYRFNYTAHKVMMSLLKSGEVKFLFGTSPTNYTFTQNGIFEITFTSDWSSILNVNRVGDLPTNRHYLSQNIIPPTIITVYKPENITYNSSWIPVKVNVNELVLWIAYSLDDGANVTLWTNVPEGTYTQYIYIPNYGNHKIVFYAKDQAGNIGKTETIYFTNRYFQFGGGRTRHLLM